MKKSNHIANTALNKVQASSQNPSLKNEQQLAPKPETIGAINQMFAELELVYHNQYTKAFSSQDKLQLAKKLWYSYLKDYTPEQILGATRQAVKESEFLPTVRGILKYLEDETDSLGMPSPRNAYHEVCLSRNPRNEFNWSHPAVYHAGLQVGWFTIENEEQRVSWPQFQDIYRRIIKEVASGKDFEIPVTPALPDAKEKIVSAEEALSLLEKFTSDNKDA